MNVTRSTGKRRLNIEDGMNLPCLYFFYFALFVSCMHDDVAVCRCICIMCYVYSIVEFSAENEIIYYKVGNVSEVLTISFSLDGFRNHRRTQTYYKTISSD